MANIKTTSASGTSEIDTEWIEKNRRNIENYARANASVITLRDVTQSTPRNISAIDKDELKGWIKSIGGNENNLRKVARYLYYRSNIFFRIVSWYADMWCLGSRKVVPKYDMIRGNNKSQFLKQYSDTLDVLDKMNLQGNMVEALTNVYIQDIYYAITYYDESGMFFFPLDPDECKIDSRYSTGDYGFSIDITKWTNKKRRQMAEWLGSPLTDLLREYDSSNNKSKWMHMPDEYAFVLKFRTDTWDMVAPPLLPTFLQIAGLEDLVDIQAEADALSIYKLIYMPMDVLSGAKESDEFQVSPDISLKYLQRAIDQGAFPGNVAVAAVPGKELKTIDFDSDVQSDTTSVEQASNQILQTAGGGAVINANNITSTAAFNAWLKAETEFAMSSLMPQINGFTNRFLTYKVTNPAKVEQFEVSVYTRETFAEQMLTSCQYSYANRLAYNTLLGISEKDTLAMLYLENEVLGLPDIMKFPLASSFTSTGDDTSEDVGAPTKSDDEDIAESTDRMRNQ